MEIWESQVCEESPVQEIAFSKGYRSYTIAWTTYRSAIWDQEAQWWIWRLQGEWLGAKVRFIKIAKGFTPNVAAPTHIEIPQAEASAQPTKEHASTADEN